MHGTTKHPGWRNPLPGYSPDHLQQFLSSRITLFPVHDSILRLAAQLRATNNLKTPDAIHAATALNIGCTRFLTNDAGLRTIPGLSVVVLKDVLKA